MLNMPNILTAQNERYLVKLGTHIFNEKSGDNAYGIHDLSSDKYDELFPIFTQLESKGITFYKAIPEAKPNDVIRTGRRTGKTVTVPDMSLWYFVELDEEGYRMFVDLRRAQAKKLFIVFQK